MTLAELLIDHGADVNARNEYDETPLHYASRRNEAGTVRMLLQRGGDADAESSLGDRPGDEAGSVRIEAVFEQYRRDGGAAGQERAGGAAAAALPNKCLLAVFSFLPAASLCRAAVACGRWHRLAEEPALWKALGVRRWELALAASMGGMRAGSRPGSRGSRPGSRGSGGGEEEKEEAQVSPRSSSSMDAFAPAAMAFLRPAMGGGGGGGGSKKQQRLEREKREREARK